jgi:hypothetical protein
MPKVLPLEGVHKRHHDHGKDASMPAKGNARAIPNEHWEMGYNPDPENLHTHMGCWDPKLAKHRPCTHNKVNETDH